MVQPAVADALNSGTMTRPIWTYGYDAYGNMTTITDPRGRVTLLKYDEHGRRTSRTLPEVTGQPAATETTTYDEYGRQEKHNDFKGNQTTYIYDVDGRLSEQRHFDPGDPTTGTPDIKYVYTYDALGRRDTVTETRGATVRVTDYDYDPITGQTSKITSPEGVINYAYDEAHGRLSRTWTAHNDTSYAYDALGRLETVTATKLNGQTVNLITTYTYTKNGQLDLLTYPNGIVSDYDYDNLGRLTDLTSKRGTTTVFSQEYVLAADGQRESVLEKRENAPDVFIDWSYDALNRLTSETRDEGNDAVQNGNDYTESFTFDLANNRRTKSHDDADNAKDETMTSTVDARDRLTTEDSTINTKDASYTYDTNGATLTKTINGTTDTYTYDQLNRLTSATVGGVAASYAYDHQGQRVQVTTGGVTTHHHHDPRNKTGYTKAVEEKATPSSAPTRSYLFGKDVIAQKDTDSEEHLVADGHGTTRAVTNVTGTVLESYNFDAFGNPVGFSAATALTTYLTSDGTYTPALGTHWHGGSNSGRYSDRAMGRWLSRDSFFGYAENPLSQHTYTFVHHDPVNRTDPTGMFFSLKEINLVNVMSVALRVITWGATTSAKQAVFRAIVGQAIATVPLAYQVYYIPSTTRALRELADELVTLNSASSSLIRGVASEIDKSFGFNIAMWLTSPALSQLPAVKLAITGYQVTNLVLAMISAYEAVMKGVTINSGGFTASVSGEFDPLELSTNLFTFSLDPAKDIDRAVNLIKSIKDGDPNAAEYWFESLFSNADMYLDSIWGTLRYVGDGGSAYMFREIKF